MLHKVPCRQSKDWYTGRGYPKYIVLAFPKSGTKTINKIFTSLGYKVFDVSQIADHASKVKFKAL